MTIKKHTGLPPKGWEAVPNMPGYIREKVVLPKDGKEGPPGPQGEPGPAGRDGVDGRDGRDGVDGKDGLPGRDGKDGKPGRDGKDGKQGERGERGPAGPAGKNGKDGADGVGIEDVTAYGRDMLIKYSNGKEKKFSLLGLSGGTPFGGGGGSGGSGGASSLSQLTDVTITSLQDNQKLVYDGDAAKWKNITSATVFVSATPPSNPKVGDIWYDIS